MQNEEEANLTPTQTRERMGIVVLARGTINVSAIRALGMYLLPDMDLSIKSYY